MLAPRPRRFLVLGVSALVVIAARAGSDPPDDEERAARTLARMFAISTLVGTYQVDTNWYPQAATIGELQQILVRTYPDLTERHARAAGADGTLDLFRDGWGNEFAYQTWDRGDDFVLASAGADLRFERSTWTHETFEVPFSGDAVMKNSVFLRTWGVEPWRPELEQGVDPAFVGGPEAPGQP